MKRLLLLLPTTGYRNDDFLDAARNLDVEIITAANYCHQLAPLWGMSPIQSVHFDQPSAPLRCSLWPLALAAVWRSRPRVRPARPATAPGRAREDCQTDPSKQPCYPGREFRQ